MKYFWSYLTLLILFIFQTTLGRYIAVFGIAPNVVFVFAVCYSMYNFPVRSAVLCLIAGLVTDCFNCRLIGFNAVIYMYIGLAVSVFGGALMKRSLWTVALGVIIAAALCQSLNLFFVYTIHGYASFWYGFLRIIVPETLYDSVFALIVSGWAKWLSEEQIRGF